MFRQSVFNALSDQRLGAKVVRGTAFIILNYGGGQLLRFGSNIILTRILFPEAFGMMVLVQTFITALEMFSDTGVNTSIIQNKRGEDRAFLDTAWTFQIARGVLIWTAAWLLAGTVAEFYGEPMLAELIPVAALSVVILGFTSTNLAVANRKIMLGRLTALTLGCQALGIVLTVLFAWWLQSVWALVFGSLVGRAVKAGLSHIVLDGGQNRLHWDRDAFWDLFNFGKYIMISSIAGFLINTGDRAILGKFVTLTDLAVYNIGWMLASVPMALARMLGKKMLFPLYAANKNKAQNVSSRKIAKVRFALTGGIIGLSLVLGLSGDWLVRTLYTPEYHLAGPILVLVSVASIPVMVFAAYGGALLGAGSSRDFTIMLIVTATLQTTLLYFGVVHFGLLGAIVAPGSALLLVYPLTAYLVRKCDSWDPVHDGLFLAIAVAIGALVLTVHPDAVSRVIAGSG